MVEPELVQKKIDEVDLPFQQTDNYRVEWASNNGGFELTDDELLLKHRSVISEMIAVSLQFTLVAIDKHSDLIEFFLIRLQDVKF